MIGKKIYNFFLTGRRERKKKKKQQQHVLLSSAASQLSSPFSWFECDNSNNNTSNIDTTRNKTTNPEITHFTKTPTLNTTDLSRRWHSRVLDHHTTDCTHTHTRVLALTSVLEDLILHPSSPLTLSLARSHNKSATDYSVDSETRPTNSNSLAGDSE